ncbi:plasmid stabilization protein [Streptomyces sp. NPDC056690]|uniref:plasmid stabilization protein n=1 Tax=unclassified Streptomyces TaxID=2593676 RepID=UPI003626B879
MDTDVSTSEARRRERQYEHVKESAEDRGGSKGRAKEIAARTVNKERARSAESASKTSTHDKTSQRGGERSHSGAQGPTKDQLYEEAKQRHIDGRSSMNKQELRKALGR